MLGMKFDIGDFPKFVLDDLAAQGCPVVITDGRYGQIEIDDEK